MTRIDSLLRSRGGVSSHYQPTCPQYIPTSTMESLFAESGVYAETGAQGAMGDVMENLALMVLETFKGKTISTEQIRDKLSEIIKA